MSEKRTRDDDVLRRAERLDRLSGARPDSTPDERRLGLSRSGEDRRKVNIPAPPGSPVRSGLDRRTAERRGADFAP